VDLVTPSVQFFITFSSHSKFDVITARRKVKYTGERQ